LSWIVKDLWRALVERRADYENALQQGKLQAFETFNRIASEAGAKWGVFIQLNFPPGQMLPQPEELGHRDLSILVYRERKKFEGVTEHDVRERLLALKPVSFDNTGFGYEGLRARLRSGRIDCLPGGVHVWCELGPDVLEFLDWLFKNAYGLKES
jgi:hypothetical protein